MPDLFDHAQDISATFFEAALSRKMKEGPKPNGRCHNCAEPLPLPERWCDEDCRDDWEKRERVEPSIIDD